MECEVIFRAGGVTQHARQQARDRVDDHQRGKFAACQHIISNRNFIGDQMLTDAFVHAFVAAAEQGDPFIAR